MMNEMITSPHEQQNEDYPQLTIADTDWTDEEREAMREYGYDDMDMMRMAIIVRSKNEVTITYGEDGYILPGTV